MRRLEKASKIGEILDSKYPETPIPLDHVDAYTLLVAVMLSAQSTDKKVNEITPKLFEVAGSPEEWDTTLWLSCYAPFFGCITAGLLIGWRDGDNPDLEA